MIKPIASFEESSLAIELRLERFCWTFVYKDIFFFEKVGSSIGDVNSKEISNKYFLA